MSQYNPLQRGVLNLSEKDSNLLHILNKYGLPKDKPLKGGFKTLFRMIVGQQISVKAADSIWYKLEKFITINEKNIIYTSDQNLNNIGLSHQKILYAKDLASKIINKEVILENLKNFSSQEAHKKLVSIKGVGDWTAEIYRLFVLCDLNSFPKGDIAVQEGAKRFFKLNERPKPIELLNLVKSWEPLRGAGALIMWQIYRWEIREGIKSKFYE